MTLRFSLIDRVFQRLYHAFYRRRGAVTYDRIYLRGTPWANEVRGVLKTLVSRGDLSPARLGGTNALDLGCGTGENSLFLSEHGFDVVGVDFSPEAIRRAQAAVRDRAIERSPRFVLADLLSPPAELKRKLGGPFQLIFDGGSLDDLPTPTRPQLAPLLRELSEPRTKFLMWAHVSAPTQLPALSNRGPSRWLSPGFVTGEVQQLFEADWQIDELEAEADHAAFLMTRRG